jgi:BON domain
VLNFIWGSRRVLAFRVRRMLDASEIDCSHVVVEVENSAILIRGVVRSRADATALMSSLLRLRGANRVVDALCVEGEDAKQYQYAALRGEAATKSIRQHFNDDSKW